MGGGCDGCGDGGDGSIEVGIVVIGGGGGKKG